MGNKSPPGNRRAAAYYNLFFCFDFCCRGTAAEMRAKKPAAIPYIIRVRVREFLRTC